MPRPAKRKALASRSWPTDAELVLNEKSGQVFPVGLTAQPDIATPLWSIDTTEIGPGHL
jgi:hypothetical protein